jgi:hypothetical protein
MSGNFQAAYRRAREKIGEAAWALLSNKEREEAIARELREIDAERSAGSGDDGKPEPAG